MITKFSFKSCLLATAAGLLVACASPPAKEAEHKPQQSYKVASSDKASDPSDSELARNNENFQFLIVGDRTGGHRPGVFDNAMDQVNLLRPEFVIGVGDLIEGYSTDADTLDQEWTEIERMIAKLKARFFYVAGNHDISNNTMAELWLERRGPSYYHFVYKDVLFLVLNTEDPPQPMSDELSEGMAQYKALLKKDPEAAQRMIDEYMKSTGDSKMSAVLPSNISEQQLQYMRKAVNENSDVRWTMVFMHKPVWDYESDTFKQLEKSLQSRPYTMVAGHNHYYKHEKRFGRDYVSMGTTGGSFHKIGVGNVDHVAWITMTDEGPLFANIELGGLHDISGPYKANY
ncbi:MAG: metallophosphoesterase [Pseudomonadales bacterium]